MAIDEKVFLYMDGSVCKINSSQIVSYSKWVEERLLPSFGDWESEVESEYNKIVEARRSLFRQDDCRFNSNIDADYEQAIGHSLNIAEVNSYMLAMAIVGLYHIFEKQVVSHIYKELNHYTFKGMNEIKTWENVVHIFKCFSTDVKSFNFYDDLNELRLVSNAIKHGPGSAFQSLQMLKADILKYYPREEYVSGGEYSLLQVDIYPDVRHFIKYKNTVLKFWDEDFWSGIGERRFLVVD
jgi:hypothetical protein